MSLQTPNTDGAGFAVRCDVSLIDMWTAWVDHTRSHMHIDHEELPDDLPAFMQQSYAAVRDHMDAALQRMGPLPEDPRVVLEIGCSTGFKTFALQSRFADAAVTGLDPDREAIELARGMATRLDPAVFSRQPAFAHGVGEDLPFDDDSVDLIVCVTVIEHVGNVDRCLDEIARVLRPGGTLYLEAPNYLWPYEPHVRAIMLPLCPKPLLRALVRLQGNARNAGYVDHLKFVHPHWLERRFAELRLDWRNLYLEKLRSLVSGHADAVAYRRLAGLVRVLGRLGIGRWLLAPFAAAGLYPSVMYAVSKPARAKD